MPRSYDLPGPFDASSRKIIESETKPLSLPAGEVLFREGDQGDSLYFVKTGSIGVYVATASGGRQLVNLISKGETVGEMALISGEPRSATVAAIRDSELLVLSKDCFDRLLEEQPRLSAALLHLLAQRLRQATRRGKAAVEPKTVAFLPGSTGVDCEDVVNRIAELLRRSGARVGIPDLEVMTGGGPALGEIEERHDHVLFAGRPDNPDWNEFTVRQADRILVLADARETGQIRLPSSLLAQRADHQLLDLVLLQDGGRSIPAGVSYWTERVPATRIFHLRRTVGSKSRYQHDDRDRRRLARIISGRGVGLVLSGGGARAFAHIGILKALTEAGIEIDFVGGVSMGAIIAAGVAMEWSAEEFVARFRGAFVETNPLSDYTIPYLGLIKGRRVEELLRRNFEDREIAELWRPFYCVSSNLTTGAVFEHRQGRVRDALRATISLPGILPPFLHAQGVLADGAAMNNLPVDIMRSMHRGPVVAVDVARDRAVGPELLAPGAGKPWYKKFSQPPIVSILMRAATVSSQEIDRRQADLADFVIAPRLDDIGIPDWKAFDRAVEIGYESAVAALAEAPAAIKPEVVS